MMIKDAVGLIGTAASEQSNRAAFFANDEQLANEAGYADAQAADAVARGATAAGLARMDASKFVAKQSVAYANSGVDQSTGTAGDVQASTAALGEYDAQVIANNAAREAFGHKKVAQSIGLKRRLLATQEGDRQTGTILGAVGQAANFFGDVVKAGA